MDRLNTRDMIQRRHWRLESGPNCVLCSDAHIETCDHFFLFCPFAQLCWSFLGIDWTADYDIRRNITVPSQHFSGPCFLETIVCAAWNIWKEQNDHIFQGSQPSLVRWKVRFQSDIMLHRYRVKQHLVQPLIDWLAELFV